jgi:hypothetical protein
MFVTLRTARWALSIALFVTGLAACSMHPLPDDVSRVSTYDIVKKIRCEAQEGLRDVPLTHPIIRNTAIGYDFAFEIDEDNDATKGKLKYEKPGFRKDSKNIWELTGSATRKRKNKREFRMVETLKEISEAECVDVATRPNWIYPITGAIGMDEVIRTYVRLEQMSKFGTINDKGTVFSEDLDYTTEVGGGIQPTLELATIVGKFRLTNATLFAEAKRKDMHSVTVALAQTGPVDAAARIPSGAIAPMGFAPLALSRPRVATAVIERAADAKTRVLIELERRRIAKEEDRLNTRLLEVLRPVP